jgi:hypothetical protein
MGNLLEGKKEDHDIKEPQISKINVDVHSEVKNNQEKNELMISSESRCDMPSDTKENQQEKVEEQEQEQEQEENQSENNKEEEEEQNQPIIKVEERENQQEEEQEAEEQNEKTSTEKISNEVMKTPNKEKTSNASNLNQNDRVVYLVNKKEGSEKRDINESYEINKEQNNNNIIYHNVAFRSDIKQEKENIQKNIPLESRLILIKSKKTKEPLDSNPKIYILSDRNEKYKNRNISPDEIRKEFVDIPLNEIKEKDIIMIYGNGIETGEYKFIGEKKIIKEDIVPNENMIINQEEINEELIKRKNKKKEKKISYEVIDKYYALTNITTKTIKKIEKTMNNNKSHKNYFYSTVNINKSNPIYQTQGKYINNLGQQNIINNISPSDNYSCYFLSQINKIRTEPQSFIGVIEDSKANIIKDHLGRLIYNGKIKVCLNTGEAAFDEAIQFLKELEPMKPLIYNPQITINAPLNEDDILDKDDLNKKIKAMMNLGFNFRSYWRDVIKDPEISFLLMIIDDNGIKSGMKRKDILCPYVKYIGISSSEVNQNFVCYVTLA